MRLSKAMVTFAHDAVIACISVFLALYLRLGNEAFALPGADIGLMTVSFLVISSVVGSLFGVYRGGWRHVSLDDLLDIIKATTVSVMLFVACLYLFTQLHVIPRSVPIIQWFLLVVMLGGSRLAYRLFRHQHRAHAPRDKPAEPVAVLLAGAREGAEQFIRATLADADPPYRVVGILHDQEVLPGQMIHGVQVLGKYRELSQVLARLASRGVRPQRLIMTPATGDRNHAATQEMLRTAERLGLTVACLPRLTDVRDTPRKGGIQLKPIALEDLLGRRRSSLNREAIRELISGRRVLVTGAGGTIGSELSRQIAAWRPAEITLIDVSEHSLYNIDLELRERYPSMDCRTMLCNIRDRDRVMQVFEMHRPELVFHAAALKHVPMVELNPGEGMLTNVLGTRNVADAASRHGALAMVQISTDEAVHPTNVMGASKRLAEFYCQALEVATGSAKDGAPEQARFMNVRFGNVLGSSGSVVPLFQRQLARGGPLTVTHPDISRFFMTPGEAVELILQAAAHGLQHPEERGQLYVLDMGEPIKIVEVARQMIRLAGLRPDQDIKIVFTGLRPGEKLCEELFDHDEQRMPAVVDGVLVAVSQPLDLENLRQVFEELEAASLRGDDAAVQRLIRHLLPGYQPCEGRAKEPEAARAAPRFTAAVDRMPSMQTMPS